MKTLHASLLVAVVPLVACQSIGAGAAAANPSPAVTDEESTSLLSPSTLDGVYTAAQAQRGRQVYEEICSNCHDAEDWTDSLFKARWDGESVYRFWFYIYESMPGGEPPYSLPREKVTDVLTYILHLNGLPTGPAELGPDDDSLDDHWLVWGDR